MRGCFAVQRGCFALASATYLFLSPTAGVFRGCDRDLRVLSPTAHLSQQLEKWAKEPEETKGFFTSFRAILSSHLIPFSTRSRNTVVVVPYDELTFLLRRCRSCAATVEPKALFGEPVSGSGAVAETVLLRNDAGRLTRTCGRHFNLSPRHSAQGSEETFGFFRLFCPLFQLLGKVGRRRQNK